MARQKKQNQISNKRKRRSRTGTPILLILLCLLVSVAAVVAAVTLFFHVGEIRVTGETRYSEEEIRAASGVNTGDNLILFDKFKVIERIFGECPYLDTIQIRRRLPETLEIIVKDCTPVAMLRDEPGEMPDPKNEDQTVLIGGTGNWLIDRNGKLLEWMPEETETKLTRVTGLSLLDAKEGSYAKFSSDDIQKPFFLLLNTAEDDDILKTISAIDFSEPYNIRLSYLQRFTVTIGSTADLSRKFRCLELIVTEKLGKDATGWIDISDTQKARFVPNKD